MEPTMKYLSSEVPVFFYFPAVVHAFQGLSSPVGCGAGVPGAGGCPTALKLDRYKTKLCLFHMQGRCCKGPHCPYAHGIDELRAPLPPGLLQARTP